MSKLIHWLFGYNSWICRKLGICSDKKPEKVRIWICCKSGLLASDDEDYQCMDTVFSEFEKGKEPTEYCYQCPEYVQMWVCCSSGLLISSNCLCKKQREFLKSNVPTETCGVCKPLPVKHKLDPKKIYKPDGKHKLVCPVLIPSFGINRMIKEEDAEWFVDTFAQQGWGNFMRLFDAGNWESYWQQENRLWFLYLKERNKFNLNKKNSKHFDCLFRRADYLVERDIMPMFTLLDNCSLHVNRPGFWSTHWMNGDRNINGTSKEAYSQTHWYEYNGLPPYSELSKKRDGMWETGRFLMDLYGYILDEAKKRYGKFFLVEIGNEIDARIDYHYMLKKFIDEKLGGNNYWRTFTSMRWFDFYEVSVNKSCIPVVHGVQDIGSFETAKAYADHGNYMVSCDGEEPLKTAEETEEVVSYILDSDSKGYEGNIRPIFEWKDNKWVNVCGKEDWTFRSLRLGLCRAFGEAFEEYLG